MTSDLLAIVGQTATGKSSLAMKIAQVLPAEIIAADSRTIYKGLDIGTAKATTSERRLVRHHLLDVVRPDQAFSVARYQQLALKAIEQIQKRGRLPILVGGSGLYVDSVLCEYDFKAGGASDALRQELAKLTVLELQDKIRQLKLVMPENKLNRRYLIRTIERGQVVPAKPRWREHALTIGLKAERQVLKAKIEARLKVMLEAGLMEEAFLVFKKYPPDCEAAKSNIYLALRLYFERKISLNKALADFVWRDLALARKQMTWFKRHPQIVWFEGEQSASEYILAKLGAN